MKHLPFSRFAFIANAFMLLRCVSLSCDKPGYHLRLDEVKAIWSKLPIYPGMVEIEGGSTMSGFDKAYVSRHFKSPSQYQEVKQFYLTYLTKEGWRLSKERQLRSFDGEVSGEWEIEFRRGEYEFVIDYAPDTKGYGWNYGISVGWFLKFNGDSLTAPSGSPNVRQR